MWIDDRDFDITYHIRRSALPSPGSDAQLHELVARLGSRPLDKSRPLWEMYLVEGLAKNRLAIYTKSHQALVNGMTALEIGHVIADRTQKPPAFGEDIWIPAREPGDAQLVLGAVGRLDRAARRRSSRPSQSAVTGVVDQLGAAARGGPPGRRRRAHLRAGHRAEQPAEHHGVAQPPVHRRQRQRSRTTATLRARYDCDVNDVVLARDRGRAAQLAAVARRAGDADADRAGDGADVGVSATPSSTRPGPGQAISEVSPFLVDLPVGEGNAVVRLSQIAHATESHSTAASLVDARTIVTLSGFAPPTLHAMGIRVATSFSARQFNLLITNVPGAQKQMYIAGTKLLETYAVPPLLDNQVLAIGVTSYNGMLYFGINADRDAMSDVDVLPCCCANRSTNCWRPRSNCLPGSYDSAVSSGTKSAQEGRSQAAGEHKREGRQRGLRGRIVPASNGIRAGSRNGPGTPAPASWWSSRVATPRARAAPSSGSPIPEPARRADRRAARAHRAGARRVVLPALRRTPADQGRDRAVRPVLVQPGRRREGDGILHAARACAVPAARRRSSSRC